MIYYQNIECGNVFDYTDSGYNEMILEAQELYDFGDPTNLVTLSDYYRIVEL